MVTLTEDIYGSYEVPLLQICTAEDRQVALLHPVGISVIAAEGRVDLIGNRDRQPIVYLATGGPQISVTERSGDSARRIVHPLFKDVTVAGWYWLEDVRLGRARKLDQVLFKELLKGVADLYEL
jgi:hypothetical protein